VLDFRTVHLSDLPAEKAPVLEEIRILIAFLANTAGAARQNKRSSLAALERVGNMLPSLSVSGKRTMVEPVSSHMAKRAREGIDNFSTSSTRPDVY
jgi:hypothetical protein